ncbi:MAG: dihydroorotate dehydrogenase electron transfer subunit [Candidatus Methylomirabilales bacterium]
MRATVVFNQTLSPAYRHLGLAAPGFASGFRAGQFVMLRPAAANAPFLPRAFSIYRLGPGRQAAVVEVLYKVVGVGTQCLSGLDPGAAVEVLGPLGNHFAPPAAGQPVVLVAGGIGVPPIAALAAELRQCGMRNAECGMDGQSLEPRTSNRQPSLPRPLVLLGGKTSEDILCVKDFEEAGGEVRIATEDGSLGARGLVTDLLEQSFHGTPALRHSGTSPEGRSARVPECQVYACGPPGMLAAVARLASAYGVPCQASVEATMACGFGACMGCAIEVHADGPGPHYKLVCKDGPVFDSREIVWSAGAGEPRTLNLTSNLEP